MASDLSKLILVVLPIHQQQRCMPHLVIPRGCDFFQVWWPEGPEEHRPTSILGVLRLRARDPLLSDRSARRFAQDDDSVGEPEEKQQVPPLRSPGFPVEVGGVGELHAAFPAESRTRGRWELPRSRKSGYAPVGMTI